MARFGGDWLILADDGGDDGVVGFEVCGEFIPLPWGDLNVTLFVLYTRYGMYVGVELIDESVMFH